ncbi:MAG: glycosyltransferase [Candidatus Omnitrophota bacterium]
MPEISVIVSSFDGSRAGNVPRLLEDVRKQTLQDAELIVVTGVSPNGKARNEGIRKTRGKFLIFLDDDVRLGHKKVFENLLKFLETDAAVGMTGGSIRVPKDANNFMRRLGQELPRWQVPIAASPEESDVVTTACCAVPRAVVEKTGLFHEGLRRGVDPEFRARLRKAGYKIILVPDTYFFHPLPNTLKALAAFSYKRGVAAAYGQRYYPKLRFEVPPAGKDIRYERRSLLFRLLRKGGTLLACLLTLKWLRLSDELCYGMGFFVFYAQTLFKAEKPNDTETA